MNDEAKRDEPAPRDIVGWREDGLIAYIFNLDRSDQFIRLYTPDQAEQIAKALTDTARQCKEHFGVKG